MKVFISWSGVKSHAAANVLRDWLPSVIQSVEPFISSGDIDTGVSWFNRIKEELDDCSFGILCLTRSNVGAPWLLYEAGALAHKVDQFNVVPLLVDLSPSEVPTPLSFFQACGLDQSSIFKLLQAINARLEDKSLDEERLKKVFSVWWPSLEDSFRQALEEVAQEEQKDQEENSHDSGAPETSFVGIERLEKPINEILELVRTISVKTDSLQKERAESLALGSRQEILEDLRRELDKLEREAKFGFPKVRSQVDLKNLYATNLRKEVLKAYADRENKESQQGGRSVDSKPADESE